MHSFSDLRDEYFNDKYEGLPRHGYTKIFENMILKDANIDVRLNMDFFKVKEILPKYGLMIFTGPIDGFYASKGWPKLEYRSIIFEVRFNKIKEACH